ncbi:MAG: FtsX-like permease family protein, partial [Verrucomicrobiaceae bacterium]
MRSASRMNHGTYCRNSTHWLSMAASTFWRAAQRLIHQRPAYSVRSNHRAQKRREIGVMKSLGASSGQIIRVFLYQGMILGTLGALLGV